jgi:hypothetical protein
VHTWLCDQPKTFCHTWCHNYASITYILLKKNKLPLLSDFPLYMFQIVTSVNIRKEFTILELSYSIKFHLISKV